MTSNWPTSKPYKYGQPNYHKVPMKFQYTSILAGNEKAFLFRIEKRFIWLPKNRIVIDTKTKTITVPYKIAVDQYIIGDKEPPSPKFHKIK